MIDLASYGKKQTTHMERAWEDFAWIYQQRIRKRDLWSASYLFTSCNFCGVGVVGLRARSDTFHAADCLERTRGIYWLCYRDLGHEDSIPFSLSLSLLTCESLFFAAQKKVLQKPVEMVACRSVSWHSLRAFPIGYVAMCVFLLRMRGA